METRLYIIQSNAGLWALWGNVKMAKTIPELWAECKTLERGETFTETQDGLTLTVKRVG